MNNYNNSNINRPNNNELDNFDIPLGNQISLEQLQKERRELDFIINKYNTILKEYQKKYGNELYNQIEKDLMDLDEQNEDITFRKKLILSVPIIKQYEIYIREKDNYISYLLNEKGQLELTNQSMLREIQDLKTKLEEKEKQNEELINDLQERAKIKDRRYNKTFSNNIINREESQEKDDNLGQGEPILNINRENKEPNMALMYNTMKENYNNLLNKQKYEYKERMEYEERINKLNNINTILQNKFNKLVKEKERISNNADNKDNTIQILEIKIKELKNKMHEDEEAYNSLLFSKNNETENLISELNEIRNNIDNIRNKNRELEEQNLNIKFEYNKLKQEIDIMKFERDNLSKIIEESNALNKNIEEKEKSLNNYIKQYEKKENDMKNENEKLETKIKVKEEQIKKLDEEYSTLLKDKIKYYEDLINETKSNYKNIIKNKDNQIKELEENNLAYKTERDKFLSDYQLAKKEYDQIYQRFLNENAIYINKYEDSQNKLNKISNDYMGNINELKIKIEELENENVKMGKDINSYNNKIKKCELKIKEFEQNEVELNRINSDLKNVNYEYLKKSNAYVNEIDRLKAQFKKQLEKEKEYNDNKIIYLENMVEKQKKQLSLAEGKALDMIKKQQMITEKYKKELQNAVTHYENIINGKIPENLTL